MTDELPSRNAGRREMDKYPPLQPHAADSLIQVINVRLDNLQSNMTGIQDVLHELVGTVNKLAVIEERQAQAAQALERAFAAIERVGTRQDVHERGCPPDCNARLIALEKAQPLQQQTTDWASKAAWAAMTLVALFTLKKVGLL